MKYKNIVIVVLLWVVLYAVSNIYDNWYCETNGADYYHVCE